MLRGECNVGAALQALIAAVNWHAKPKVIFCHNLHCKEHHSKSFFKKLGTLEMVFFSKLGGARGTLHTVSKEGRCNSGSTLTHYFGNRAVNTSAQPR